LKKPRKKVSNIRAVLQPGVRGTEKNEMMAGADNKANQYTPMN